MNHIETQRLILRHFTEEDINALFSILSDKDVNTFLPMFPLKDIEEAKDYLQYIKSWIQQKGFYYAICMKTNYMRNYLHTETVPICILIPYSSNLFIHPNCFPAFILSATS